MANYIVDASVMIEYFLVGKSTPNAQSFFNSLTEADHVIAPEFSLLECTNVIWKQVRFSGMSLAQAYGILNDLRARRVEYVSVSALLNKALEIGVRNQLAVYDSTYIALALFLGYPLISIDENQLRAATTESAIIIPLNSFST